jgi:vacuolar-type H+-ATPase subunit E/Vma4
MESTSKTAGDFANTSDGLANSMRIMKAEIADTQAEIGQQLLPVLEEIIPVVREMVGEFGTKLLAAVKAVDFKSLLTDIANFTGFLITNIETISKVVAAVYILNTAFKLMAVASGIATVAIKLQAWFTAQLATGMTIATVTTTLLSAAMRLIPFVAIASGLALIVNGIMNIGNEAGKSEHNVRVLNGQITTGAALAPSNANKYVKVAGGFKLIETAADNAALAVEAFNKPSDSESRNRRHALREQNRRLGLIGSTGSAFALPDFSSMLSSMTGGSDSGNFQAELDRLAREAENAAADAAQAMSDIQRDAAREAENYAIETQNAAQDAADAEQAILDKRLNAFESFNNSVKNLFGQIKDNILSSFNLPTLGNSVNSITRNIGKLLEKTKGFANDISQLSGMGLNSALLQQVIQAGPLAGSRLASAIVGGGSAFISQLNSAYGEMGGLASGIAGVGTRSAFDNPTIANTYNIEVNGGVGSGPTIGKAIVDAIKSYERTSGAVWQGA